MALKRDQESIDFAQNRTATLFLDEAFQITCATRPTPVYFKIVHFMFVEYYISVVYKALNRL